MRDLRVCVVADYRSPIARGWIRNLVDAGAEVTVFSSYPCEAGEIEGVSVTVLPLAFAALTHSGVAEGKLSRSTRSWLRSGLMGRSLRYLRHVLAPLTTARKSRRLRQLIESANPDLVHALRIPFEGIVSAEALRNRAIPLVISIWGNDLTLVAPKTPLLKRATKRALARADALIPDCERDLSLATAWGFDPAKPCVVLPSGGGLARDLALDGDATARMTSEFVVFNPRGIRPYARTDTFFQAVKKVLNSRDDVVFVCLAMAASIDAEAWIEKLGIRERVTLLPALPHREVMQHFSASDIFVSVTTHDGTANSLLEGMSAGAFPVVSNIPSMREWIKDGVNGMLFDPRDPDQLAACLLGAIADTELRRRARSINLELIRQRAERGMVRERTMTFYEQVLQHRKLPVARGDQRAS